MTNKFYLLLRKERLPSASSVNPNPVYLLFLVTFCTYHPAMTENMEETLHLLCIMYLPLTCL
uniref:Uncharacterized protein n=1 Tax=Anguilla anguilla TaxID=7936 RepID=A0A0E9X6F3_ANGAN